MRLQTKLALLIVSLLLLVIVLIGIYFQFLLAHTLKEQIGMRVFQIAETVSSIPEIRDAFSKEEPWKIIQPIAEEIRKKTGADFVVIGNVHGIRYSHPVASRIGKKMEGGDNEAVLKGKAIISEAKGSLGPSLRGKVPIYNKSGKIVGIASVGFSLQDVETTTKEYRNRIILLGIGVLFIGIIGAFLISRSVKRAILGLEPKEITHLYQEKKAVLESIKEGVVAVNLEGIITTVNQPGIDMLHLTKEEVIGKRVTDVLPHSPLLKVIQTGKAEYDREMVVGDDVFIVNRLPIVDEQGKVIGAVSSFRSKSELYRVMQELSQVKRYAEVLRAQTHEYSNKLHMIAGLIQLESYQEAIEFIAKESDIHQDLLQFIMREIPDVMIGGLLIGKFNQANELRITLDIDRGSSFKDIPSHIDRECLITILGNLIDNAMDSVIKPEAKAREITMSFTDYGNDLIIEIEDVGVGVPEENRNKIFNRGFSTKAEKNHGVGLYLVKQAVEQLKGYITYAPNQYGGSIFTVVIPKDTA
jgi:two-component system CitB family sensor kinase